MASALLESPASLFAGEDAALEVIDVILARGGQVLYDHYIRDRVVPFATANSLNFTFEVAHTRFLDADPGEPGHASSSAWTAEEEPAPSKCDAWARGTVPLKARKKKPPADDALDASGRPMSSASSRMSRPRSRKAMRGTSGGETARLKTDEEPKIMMRTSTPSHGEAGGGGEEDDAGPMVTEEERAYMAKIAEMERLEAEEEARKERARAIERAEVERMERVARDYKGKSITFDHRGNVVLVRPPRVDKLPPETYNMGLNIADAHDETNEDDASPKRRRRTGGGTWGRGKGKGKGRGTAVSGVAARAGDESAGDDAFFTVSDATQPPLLSTIKLEVGVNARADGEERKGPVPRADPQRMSRRDFEHHQSQLESRTGKVTRLGGDGGGGEGAGTSSAAPAAQRSPHAAAAQQSPPGSPQAPPLPSIDPRAGGKQRAARSPMKIVTDEDDPNLQLVNSPDWGANTAVNPDFEPGQAPPTPKPTPKQSELLSKMMGGEAVRNPRDRPYVIRDTSPRKHMPPPPLGQSTGHGLSPSSKTAPVDVRGGGGGGGGTPKRSTVQVQSGKRNVL